MPVFRSADSILLYCQSYTCLFIHSQQEGIKMFFLRAQYNLVHITVINICLETTAYAIELPLPHQGVQRIQI